MSDIKPALTPEEWGDATGMEILSYLDNVCRWVGEHEYAGAAAMLLMLSGLGDTPLFTWEDVEYLDDVIQAMEDFGGTPPWIERARSIRGRITALLPPREP